MQSLLHIFELAARGEPEAEGMAAAKAHVFGPLASPLVDRDEVAQHHAGQRVPDNGERALCLEKRVTASARVFGCFRSGFHHVNAMAQEPAGVVNSLLEF